MLRASHEPAAENQFAHYIPPARGHWKYSLLNLLLRSTVKWWHGSDINIGKVRARLGMLNRHAPEALPGIERSKVQCSGVPCEWLVPEDPCGERVLLYVHGGAFVASTPDVHAAMVAPWCQSLRAQALMVDYRLSPEHRFPAAITDCLKAYHWLLEQGIRAENIIVAGDSAGGNLALAMLLHLRDKQRPLPACAVLLSPFLDFTLSGRSALTNSRRDPIFTPAFAIRIRGHYAPADLYSTPEVSPLFGDFSGLPPLLFQVGSTEMLLDDSVRAASKASEVGTPVQLDIWERMPHVFQAIVALPQARIAAQRISHFIRQNTG